jgi:hypothetical protein
VTICVGVQVNDCLVFAADSAVTLFYSGPSGAEVVNVLQHGNKVFNLHRDLPICGMTCGLGNIGADSVTTLAKDLRILLMSRDHDYQIDPERYTIEEVAVKAREFLFENKFSALSDKPKAELSFYVGGYSSNSSAPERWLVKIQGETNSSPPPECLGKTCGLSWGGQPEAISRLVMGVGIDHAKALADAGLSPDQIKAVSASLLKSLQAHFLHPAMPVQDAIDFADFLVETTKRFVRFLPGADTVGGDTDIAVVTKHEGFKWVRRKHYFNTVLNPGEVTYGARYPIEKGKPGHSAGAGAPT